MGYKKGYIVGSFLKRSGMWTATKVIQALITFLIFYIYALFLSKTDYGNYQKAFVLTGFLSGLLSFGFHVYIPALPLEEFEAVLRNIFRKAGWVILIFSTIFVTCVYIIFPGLSFLEKSLAVCLGLFNALNLIYELYALKQSRDRFVLTWNILFSCFYLFGHLAILLSYKLSILLLVLVFVALLRLSLYYSRFGAVWNNKGTPNILSNKNYYQQWSYAALNETFELLSKHIDKIVLVGLLAAADFAAYFNGSYEIPLLGLLVSVAGTFTNLQTVQYKLGNPEIKDLFYSITSILAAIVFPLFFFAWLYATPLFEWLFNNKYNDSIPFFLIYVWVIPLRICNYTAILQEKMRGHLIISGSISALLLKLILIIILYHVSGVRGIAMACVAGTFYQVLFYLFHIAKSLEIPINQVLPFKRLSIVFLFSLGFNTGLYLFLHNLPSIWQIFGGLVTAGVNACIVLWFYVKKQINTLALKGLPV